MPELEILKTDFNKNEMFEIYLLRYIISFIVRKKWSTQKLILRNTFEGCIVITYFIYFVDHFKFYIRVYKVTIRV